jgi:hypothetical protein
MRLQKYILNEEKYEVSNTDMKKGYWKVIDKSTGETVESGFSTKKGAEFAAKNLNRDGRQTIAGKWKNRKLL